MKGRREQKADVGGKKNVRMDEDDILREQLRDEIVSLPEENEKPVPEVGADQREYENEELRRQGQTDEGLTNPLDDEDAPPETGRERGRKIA